MEQREFVDALTARPMEIPPTMSRGVLPILGNATAGRVSSLILRMIFEADIDRRDSLKQGAILSASPRRRNSLMENQASPTRETGQPEQPAAQTLHPPSPDSPSMVLTLIERLALDPHADVEKLERIMAMYERRRQKRPSLHTMKRRGAF